MEVSSECLLVEQGYESNLAIHVYSVAVDTDHGMVWELFISTALWHFMTYDFRLADLKLFKFWSMAKCELKKIQIIRNKTSQEIEFLLKFEEERISSRPKHYWNDIAYNLVGPWYTQYYPGRFGDWLSIRIWKCISRLWYRCIYRPDVIELFSYWNRRSFLRRLGVLLDGSVRQLCRDVNVMSLATIKIPKDSSSRFFQRFLRFFKRPQKPFLSTISLTGI